MAMADWNIMQGLEAECSCRSQPIKTLRKYCSSADLIKPLLLRKTFRQAVHACRRVAIVNLLLAPFLLVFLLIYFFMRNAEKFYHQPSSAGARRWSALAAWRLREFNEVPHYLNHRRALPH